LYRVSITATRPSPKLNQQWLPISTGGNGYKFQNVAAHLCLEARGGAANGTLVPMGDCSSTESNTRWAWDQSSPGRDGNQRERLAAR
jgi:Ricin-type beta-trefoil lectin domain-like